MECNQKCKKFFKKCLEKKVEKKVKKKVKKLECKIDELTSLINDMSLKALIESALKNNHCNPHSNITPIDPHSNVTPINPHSNVTPINLQSVSASPKYYTPPEIITAYSVNKIVIPNNKPMGYGIKVGIILAYHNPNLQSDLNKYCKTYSLAETRLSIINQSGSVTNSAWAIQGSIDTQMLCTIAPGATIFVVEAKDNSLNSLTIAIQTAENIGCSIIVMSFGCPEFYSQLSLEQYFSNSSISYIASSGDLSNIVSYPSASPNICSVGGTTLTLNPDFTRLNETTWDSAGNGPSIYEALPTYQSNISTITGNKRITPDVSFFANGFSICWEGSYYASSGTSVSAPLFAGIVAIANQLRKSSSKSLLTTVANSAKNIQKCMYQTIYANNPNNLDYTQAFYDITSGSNGIYTAGIGYDYCCGLGSVNANFLCNQLLNI